MYIFRSQFLVVCLFVFVFFSQSCYTHIRLLRVNLSYYMYMYQFCTVSVWRFFQPHLPKVLFNKILASPTPSYTQTFSLIYFGTSLAGSASVTVSGINNVSGTETYLCKPVPQIYKSSVHILPTPKFSHQCTSSQFTNNPELHFRPAQKFPSQQFINLSHKSSSHLCTNFPPPSPVTIRLLYVSFLNVLIITYPYFIVLLWVI